MGPFALQRAWGAVDASGLVPGQVLEVVAARHSRFGDVTGAVDMAGSYDLGLAVGDTLGLTYGPAADPTAAGQKWFLVVGPPSDPKSTAGLGRPGLDERNSLPTQFALRQNQPNPFSGRTTMRFELPRETHVRLDIFDAQGRLVRTVADHRFPAGFHGVDWDRRNAGGTSVAPGVYLYQIHAGSFLEQKKMVLLPR